MFRGRFDDLLDEEQRTPHEAAETSSSNHRMSDREWRCVNRCRETWQIRSCWIDFYGCNLLKSGTGIGILVPGARRCSWRSGSGSRRGVWGMGMLMKTCLFLNNNTRVGTVDTRSLSWRFDCVTLEGWGLLFISLELRFKAAGLESLTATSERGHRKISQYSIQIILLT